MRINFLEFTYIWLKLQGLSFPHHQKQMSKWLEKLLSTTNRQGLLMAFRNSGKSTIVGLFCAWLLYQNNSSRILVIAADHALAKKMVRNVKRIIERHPLTKSLKPEKLDQWASDQFTIKRSQELRDPSMLAKGLGANITGLRADIIICDDVEVPKNCDSSLKRVDMREKLQELNYILSPDGLMLYIGTPHTFYTIYQTEFDETKKETEPFLLGFTKLMLPILDDNGESAWPERFSKEKIASIRMQTGENKFISQMMLKPVNIADSRLNPNGLVAYSHSLDLSFIKERQHLKLGDNKLISASCCWDPSFGTGTGDNSVIACIFTDEKGGHFLHDVEYIKVAASGNAATKQCEKVADFLERNFLSSVRVETNGIGKFLPAILREVLSHRKLKVAVLETTTTRNKASKILEAFEVLLAERRLFVHQKIWATGFIEEMREWKPEGNGKDDALDAVAECLLSEPIRVSNIVNTKDFKHNNWQGTSTQFSAKTTFDL